MLWVVGQCIAMRMHHVLKMLLLVYMLPSLLRVGLHGWLMWVYGRGALHVALWRMHRVRAEIGAVHVHGLSMM